MAVGLKLEGTAALLKALNALPRETRGKLLNSAIRKGARIGANEVKAAAPGPGDIAPNERTGTSKSTIRRRTYGRLKDNIRVIRDKEHSSATQAAVKIDTGTAFWAAFQEFGTSTNPPRPFMRRSIEGKLGAMEAAIGKTLERGIARAAKKLAGPIGSTLKRGR